MNGSTARTLRTRSATAGTVGVTRRRATIGEVGYAMLAVLRDGKDREYTQLVADVRRAAYEPLWDGSACAHAARRLIDAQLMEKRERTTASGYPIGHVYGITPLGRTALSEQLSRWLRLVDLARP